MMSNQKLHNLESTEWYVVRGSHRYGPISYREMIKHIHAQTLNDRDLVWRKELKAWTAIQDLLEFAPETVRQYLNLAAVAETTQAFQAQHSNAHAARENVYAVQRRYQRVSCDVDLIVHNHKKVLRGHGVELSLGGAGLMLSHPDFAMGDEVVLHFKPSRELEAFNAVCQVAAAPNVHTTHRSGDKQNSINLKYCVKFQDLDSIGRRALVDYFANRQSA